MILHLDSCDNEENVDFMERSDIHVQSNCRD